MTLTTAVIIYISVCLLSAQPVAHSIHPHISRPIAALACVTLVLVLQQVLDDLPLLSNLPLWKTMLKSYLWVQTLQSLNNLVFDPLYLDSAPPPTNTGRAATLFMSSQTWEAVKSNWRWRAIGTPREAKNTPELPESAPSRSSMIGKHLIIAMSCFVALDLISSAPQPDPQVAMAARKHHIFGRNDVVNVDELSFRAAATLGFWVGTFLGINAMYSCLAVLMMLLKSDPNIWRPVVGDVREAYSIRRFWG